MGMFGFPDHLADYSAVHYLRLLVVVCAYLILRPYLLKFGEKIQKAQLDKQKAERDREAAAAIMEKEKVAEEPKQNWKWGQKAKNKAVRQRKVANKEISEADARKQAAIDQLDSDEDVADLLE
jgi:hypothetical protein